MAGMIATTDDCPSCRGRKVDTYYHPATNDYREETCATCRGLGIELTALGSELLDFLEKYFELRPKAK